MEREDKFLSDRFGRRTPFKVPDGYFDDFASLLMQKLPESNGIITTQTVVMKPSLWHGFRPIAIAAASVCVAIFGVGIYVHNNQSRSVDSHVGTTNNVSSASFSIVDAIADYAMYDTEDMYAYMEDAE